ncbi:hypothetical protein GCM10023169_17860 [Georgenia halophila]|uniref:Uncharacterized protein n=1 Tax=Georgenia halophila TaxID=620889 RepID=A0ABP8L4Y3_9MICO
MGDTPVDRSTADGGPTQALEELSALDGIEDVPLGEQVEVFETIHDRLAARLSGAES